MQGTRLPDAQMGEPGPGWDAWDNGNCVPGAYMKVSTAWEGNPGGIIWYIRDPTGEIGSIHRSHHTVTEHEDGTITVSPSILKHGGYHGFLSAGVWSSG
jgi:hypothetical protein